MKPDMTQTIQDLSEQTLPSEMGISVVFYDDENITNESSQGLTPLQVENWVETAPTTRKHTHSLRRMIFNPLHPSSELPPENLIELRKVHAGLAQRRKKKIPGKNITPSLLSIEEPFDELEKSRWAKTVLSMMFVTSIVITFFLLTNPVPTVAQQSYTANGIPVFEQIGNTGIPNPFDEPESGMYIREI